MTDGEKYNILEGLVRDNIGVLRGEARNINGADFNIYNEYSKPYEMLKRVRKQLKKIVAFCLSNAVIVYVCNSKFRDGKLKKNQVRLIRVSCSIESMDIIHFNLYMQYGESKKVKNILDVLVAMRKIIRMIKG